MFDRNYAYQICNDYLAYINSKEVCDKIIYRRELCSKIDDYHMKIDSSIDVFKPVYKLSKKLDTSHLPIKYSCSGIRFDTIWNKKGVNYIGSHPNTYSHLKSAIKYQLIANFRDTLQEMSAMQRNTIIWAYGILFMLNINNDMSWNASNEEGITIGMMYNPVTGITLNNIANALNLELMNGDFFVMDMNGDKKELTDIMANRVRRLSKEMLLGIIRAYKEDHG